MKNKTQAYEQYEEQKKIVLAATAVLEKEAVKLTQLTEAAAFEDLAKLEMNDIVEVAYKRYKFGKVIGAEFHTDIIGEGKEEAVPICVAVKMDGTVTEEKIHPRYLHGLKKAAEDCFVKKE